MEDMTERVGPADKRHPPEIVTELRAIEWELEELARRLEVLRDRVHELQESRDAGT